MNRFHAFLMLAASALPLSASAAELVFINHTGALARIAVLFNVCEKDRIPEDQPVMLQDGENVTFEVPLVMNHYKICGSGFCTSSSVQMKEGNHFEVEMVLPPSGVIKAILTPDQWGGPTNECP